MKWRDITNPPKLLYIEGKECNGILGYYCTNDKHTYCMGDNQKIVQHKTCLSGMPCRRGKTNPCICDDNC
jgi:hypothetical protein